MDRMLQYLGWRAGPETPTNIHDRSKWWAAAIIVAAVIVAIEIRLF